MLLACCCTDCCQLCIGKQCDVGVNWNGVFDGAGPGLVQDVSSNANVTVGPVTLGGAAFVGPQTIGDGGIFPGYSASEQGSGYPYCIFGLLFEDTMYYSFETGDIAIYKDTRVWIFRGDTSGNLMVYTQILQYPRYNYCSIYTSLNSVFYCISYCVEYNYL